MLSILIIAALALGVAAQSSCSPSGFPAPAEKILSTVRTASISVPKSPFGIVYTSKKTAFVALDTTVGVLNTTTFPPTLVQQIQLPPPFNASEGLAEHHGRVLVAAANGAVILDRDAVVGTLTGHDTGTSAIEITVSGNYAFISQEYGPVPGRTPGNLDVFRLDGTNIGHLNLDYLVVGTALSPDGRTLYATSESTTPNATTPGILSVIDVATLKRNPGEALRAQVAAGCSPVRVIVSKRGIVWVTARGSNRLLAFDPEKLACGQTDAIIASVQVGTAPVGLTFVRNETRILTADSNRFPGSNATTGISVVDVQAALESRNALLGQIPTGLFPREFAVSPDGKTVLVTNFGSKEVQAIDVPTLP